MNQLLVEQKLREFFNEDIGTGDLTVTAIYREGEVMKGTLIAKQEGVFAGEAVIATGYSLLDSKAKVDFFIKDGETVSVGDKIAEVTANVHALLSGERVILNLIQRMSGIATLTSLAKQRLNDSHIQICDTRKTVPGLRMFDKYAVRCGGGMNHRIGLYDGVMIKDNHIVAAGGIKEAVQRVKSVLGHMVKIEVETESEEEVKEAVEAGADIIMFDNCTPEKIKEFVKLVPEHIITEISGGITLENIAHYQGTGVHYLSLGFLTHSVTSLDISFNLQGGRKG
ncbi:MAG TPA: carboxylating nicotinate-nucleotide diphosphorylase [Bacilli bacterium]|nr:carboxylating nicotinate-nucleotide diphosphorylase [Bacilli bacterium]